MKRFGWIAAAMLAGCAEAPVYEGLYAYDDGWSIGKVAEIGSASSLTERASKDCRLSAAAQGKAKRTFARVHYQRGRQYRSIIAVVSDGFRPAPGEDVYVNFQDCDLEIEPRHKARTR